MRTEQKTEGSPKRYIRWWRQFLLFLKENQLVLVNSFIGNFFLIHVAVYINQVWQQMTVFFFKSVVLYVVSNRGPLGTLQTCWYQVFLFRNVTAKTNAKSSISQMNVSRYYMFNNPSKELTYYRVSSNNTARNYSAVL